MSAFADLAEAYVLGLLDAAETAEVDARLAEPRSDDDRALAVAVGSLRDRLLPLDLTAPEPPLRPGAWERLERAIDNLAQPAAPIRPTSGRPLPRRVAAGNRWRLAAFGSMAAALVLAAALGWQLLTAPAPAVLAVLLDQAGDPVAVLEASADNRVLVTPLVGVEPGPTQVLQLWTLPDPDGDPVSLGLLEEAARVVVSNPDLPQPVAGQLYEITVEPEGGSPTGLPTGPVIGIGNARAPVLE